MYNCDFKELYKGCFLLWDSKLAFFNKNNSLKKSLKRVYWNMRLDFAWATAPGCSNIYYFCRASYLRTMHHMIVICGYMIVVCGSQVWNDNISTCFFHFFKVLIFRVVRRVKEQKLVQNDKKLCLAYLISQEPYIIWSSFMVTCVKG